MKHRTTLALATALLVAATASAQERQMQWSDASGLDYALTNFGMFGHDVARNNPGLARNGLNYLYGGGLYVAARKNVRDTLRPVVVLGYNPNSGASWFTPGEFPGLDSSLGAPVLYYSGNYDHTTGVDLRNPVGPAWPLWLPADQSAPSTMSPGLFIVDPASRSAASGPLGRPAFHDGVSEQWVTRYHDGDLDRYEGQTESGGYPVGLQIQQSVYSWTPIDTYHNVVVLQYELINASNDTLRDCFVGQASDPDIGSAANDHVGFYRGSDGRVRAGIAYTERGLGDTLGYGALVQVLLEAPSAGDNGFIDNSLRRSLGSLHEITTFRDWSIAADPKTAEERYDFMATPRLDPDSAPGDKRTMLSVGPFSMMPGDTAHFAMAYVVYDTLISLAVGTPVPGPISSGDGLDLLIASLVEDYAVTGVFRHVIVSSVGRDEVAAGALAIVPNPASAASVLRFTARGGEATVIVIDALGNVVRRTNLGVLAAGPQQTGLDCSGLPDGAYLVRVLGADGGAARLTIAR